MDAELLKAAPDPIVLIDMNGRIKQVNPAFETTFGYNGESIIGERLGDRVIPARFREENDRILARCLQLDEESAQVQRLDTTAIRANGAEFPIELFIIRIVSAEGPQIGCFFREVTHLKQTEEKLREVSAYHERAVAQVRDMLENALVPIRWDREDGIILQANRAELEMLGFTAEEYHGRHFADFHIDRAAAYDILERLRRGETITDCPAQLRCKDGSIRHVLISANVYREGGQFIHTRCFTHDVTERKEAEERLLAAERAKKKFHHEVLLAITGGKLHLVDHETIEIPDDDKTAIRLVSAEDTLQLRHDARAIAKKAGMSAERLDDLELAVGEGAGNAIKHGLQGRSQAITDEIPTPLLCARATVSITSEGTIVVRISDTGTGIDLEKRPGTVVRRGFSTVKSLGMGFTLMLEMVDRLLLATGPSGTVVQLEMALHHDPNPDEELEKLLDRFSEPDEVAAPVM